LLTFCQPTPVDPQTSYNDSGGDPTGLTCSNGCRKWKRLGLQVCPYSSGENTGKLTKLNFKNKALSGINYR